MHGSPRITQMRKWLLSSPVPRSNVGRFRRESHHVRVSAFLRTLLALPFALGVGACQGCRTGSPGDARAPIAAHADAPPTVRLVFVSDLAGALEPCGCTKDQLGGLGHFGAWMAKNAGGAPQLLGTAGPLFYMDDALDPQRADQDRAKAETMARVLRDLNFVAMAPGQNDWADGAAGLAKLGDASGAAVLVGSPAGPPFASYVVREIHDPPGAPGRTLRVGFVGTGAPPPGGAPDASGAEAAVRAGVTRARAEGAQVIVALAAGGRGQAKRIADAVPELTAVVVGSPKSNGDANTEAPPVERLGDVLVIQTANHLQSAAVLDLVVRDWDAAAQGAMRFADGSGLELASRRNEVTRRIDDLHVRIAAWERDGKVGAADLAARRRDLADLEASRDALDVQPAPPKGNFFRYATKEIRESLGTDPSVEDAMRAYYKGVDEHNRVELQGRLPIAAAPGQPTYIGIDACSSCHPGPRQVWNATKHAHAYATLSSQFKEFNLDCVSCHVTGYEQPGGSTVTHVDKLENVECEVCHGPGSKHAANPKDPSLILAAPQLSRCLDCHHPPHVEGFDPAAKLSEILGPGHGMPSR
jgi:2',3'-cyclic-nucleotide 2'-phosphodiesterase (5'-nucleotidase family)